MNAAVAPSGTDDKSIVGALARAAKGRRPYPFGERRWITPFFMTWGQRCVIGYAIFEVLLAYFQTENTRFETGVFILFDAAVIMGDLESYDTTQRIADRVGNCMNWRSHTMH